MVKVLVGCPTSEHKRYCLQAYAAGLKALRGEGIDFLLVDNSKGDDYLKEIQTIGLPVVKGPFLPKAKDRIVASRNILREKVLKEGYDYFFSLEQDVVPPTNVVQILLQNRKPVVSGVVFTKFIINELVEYQPLVWDFDPSGDPEKMRFFEERIWIDGLYPIKACGLGCILIHRSVLEKISFRLFDDRGTFDDIPFCKDAAEQRFGLFVDTRVKCKHYVEKMDWEEIERVEGK